MPFIDDSHIESTDDETPHSRCCSTTKPTSEGKVSAKQKSKNIGSRCTLQASQFVPHMCANSIKDDDINHPSIIDSSIVDVKGVICPSNKEYRANIEKYCLNLNPYTSKEFFLELLKQ